MKNKHLAGGLFAAKPTPLTQTESSISKQVKEYLDARRIYNERLNCGIIKTVRGNWVHLCEEGTPDRLAVVRGQAIFIETKTFGKNPTKAQLEKHAELERSGAIVLVADSFDKFKQQFEAVRAVIESARREELFL